MRHIQRRRAITPRPGTVQEPVWLTRESKPSRRRVIHMARTGAKGTFCGRSADPSNSIDPYVSQPPLRDRWCKACYATTAHVAHVAPVGYGDGYSDEPEPHVIRFGRPV